MQTLQVQYVLCFHYSDLLSGIIVSGSIRECDRCTVILGLLLFLVSILQTAHLWANTGVVFRELSFSRLECGVHDRLHIYPMCGIFYFPWHRHQIEGTSGFYCLIRKTERFTISNVESQVFTPNNSPLDPGSNPGCPRDKRMSYHWTNCVSLLYA